MHGNYKINLNVWFRIVALKRKRSRNYAIILQLVKINVLNLEPAFGNVYNPYLVHTPVIKSTNIL